MIECMVLSVYIVRCGPLGCTPAIYIELENYVGMQAMTNTGFQMATGATNKHRQAYVYDRLKGTGVKYWSLCPAPTEYVE